MAWTSGFLEGIVSALGDVGVPTLPTTLEMSTEADKTVRVQLMVQRWLFRRSGEWEEAFWGLPVELEAEISDLEVRFLFTL